MRLVIGIVLAVAAQLGSATYVLRGKQTSLTHQHAATHAMHTLHKQHEEPEEESAEQVMAEQDESEEETTDASEEETTDASEEETTDVSEEDNNEQGEDAGYGDASEGEDVIDHDAAVSDDSTKFEFKFAKKGEKHWHVPNMKPLGFFKGAAGLSKDGLNQTLLDSTFQPTMIPTDGFAIRAATPLKKKRHGRVTLYT